MSDGPAYCPFYCEENIWWLAADPRVGPGRRRVLMVSNATRTVALWRQRPAAGRQDGLVVWDYHVILAVGATIWDLDSELGAPLPADPYLAQTFRPAPSRFLPQFRVMDAANYREVFASDRRHMRGQDGGFVRAPPRWPRIGEPGSDPHTLPALLDFARDEPGEVLDLPGLAGLLAGS